MKKAIVAATALIAGAMTLSLTGCGKDPNTIYVDTNAFFAPFEYYDGTEIKGVDVDIMNMVGEKLGKKVVFENTDFGVIIDNVASGKKYDCGAAGITITEARAQQVEFSTPYYSSVQYVIYKGDTLTQSGTTADGVEYVLWSQLAGLDIGVQRDTTGDLYVTEEAESGVIEGNGEPYRYDDATVAVTAIGTTIDVVVVDKLPAEYLVSKNSDLKCFALYYDENTATEEQYAICVTPGNTELLNAINEVLAELGEEGVNNLVALHFGLD